MIFSNMPRTLMARSLYHHLTTGNHCVNLPIRVEDDQIGIKANADLALLFQVIGLCHILRHH